jgi:cardiolipin synthase A/B
MSTRPIVDLPPARGALPAAAPSSAGPRERSWMDRALTRAAGAALVPGNSARVLKDAAQNYSAWLDAIRGARHKIYFESYFVVEDELGEEFAEALKERARGGVRVRLIYDWLGSFNKASRRYWRSLSDAGVDVRCFNPPRLAHPFEWLHRDHRKMLAVDGRVAFITGLCVGCDWSPRQGDLREPWRDTGMQLSGPALHDVERSFAEVWAQTGEALPSDEITTAESISECGDVALRIVANAPGTAALLRVDQVVAAAARNTLWLTDAYFAGIPPYVQALRAAALDGVDVRLLVPGASDIPMLRPLSHAGFRPLLEAGVRVFEWKGAMLHAKTAVADGYWSRVGSSNLNIASWIGNYELDAFIENETFAASMEQMYLEDLENTTELVLHPRGRRFRALVGQSTGREQPPRDRASGVAGREFPRSGGSATRAAASALRLGRRMRAVLRERRALAPTDTRLVVGVGTLLLVIALVAFAWPELVAYPLAVLTGWLALLLLARAYRMWRDRRRRGLQPTRVARASKTANEQDTAG